MKHIIFTGALLLASALTGEAMAVCDTNQVTSGLVALLTNNNAPLGNTACDASAKYNTSIKHPDTGGLIEMGVQEEHHNDFTLWDFKCGPAGFPGTAPGTACEKPDTDRRTQVGTWSVTNDTGPSPTVTYLYPAPSGPYTVYNPIGNTYEFCNGLTLVSTVTLVATTGTTRVCP